MKLFSFILICVFCGSSAKFSCKAPFDCLTSKDCKERHSGMIKKILLKCGKSSVCCPPLETLTTEAVTETKLTTAETNPVSTSTEYTTAETNPVTTSTEDIPANKFQFPTDKCGQRPEYDRTVIIEKDNKVYKGKGTAIGEIPWIVHITAIGSNNDRKFCGGTLIEKNYVLTAAHCFPDDSERIEIKLGTIDLNATRKCSDSLCMPIIREGKQIIHEEFKTKNPLNDIALVRLNESVKFNDFIQPACLPERSTNYNVMPKKNVLLTAGWGTNGRGNRQSRMLLGAKQSFYNFDECKRIYEKFLPQEKVAETHICALGKNKSRGLKGDSGGPLLASEKNKRFVVIGVLSRGPNNFRHKKAAPVLYTKVNYYLDWIFSHVKE